MTHRTRTVGTLTQGGERSPGSGGKRAWHRGRERDNAWNPRSQTPSGRQEEEEEEEVESNSAVTKCATVGGTSRWNC